MSKLGAMTLLFAVVLTGIRPRESSLFEVIAAEHDETIVTSWKNGTAKFDNDPTTLPFSELILVLVLALLLLLVVVVVLS